jgi:hypothetical protein
MAKTLKKMNGKVVGFDVAGLFFMCVQTHLPVDNYMHSGYSKPLRQFLQTLIYLFNKIWNLGFKLFLMFDGCNSKWKANE